MNGRFFRGIAFFPLLLLAALALPVGARAQSAANSAQIVGVVVDPTQAAVANVPVVARNTSTNYERSVVTDAAGRYAFTQLPLGPYDVRVTAQGFEAARQQVTLTLASGSTQTGEISAGSGYASQSAAACFFGWDDANPPREVRVRWPSGAETKHAFPAGATSLELPAN